ncbi:MAG: tRNA (guanosine(37)-N1)-methyltransferase TrmD [Lautropia sp.]
MDFELITLFPEPVEAMAAVGVTGRALAGDSHRLRCWNPRDFAEGRYRRVDDRPYGGGPGMVMLAEPLLRTLAAIRADRVAQAKPVLPVIHLSPQGTPLVQARLPALASRPGAILLCGRYEAIDQRFLDAHVDEEISIGDFVVSGGELPALMLIDAILRLVPGTLNDPLSAQQESFADGLLDCPHYTRPESLDGEAVPPVLLSGDHAAIAAWRRSRAIATTAARRPDLFEAAVRAGRVDSPGKGGAGRRG